MIKYLIFIFNALALFLYSLFFDGPVVLTPVIPKEVNIGTEFVAEIKIKKSSVAGFAKLQIDLPPGLTGKEKDSKGASFSSSNAEHTLKYIWTSLPAEEEFTVTFIIDVENREIMRGDKQIFGKFSYILNNSKQQEEFAYDIKVGGDVVGNVRDTSQTKAPVTNPDENAAKIICKRTITPEGDGFLVDITVKKESVIGFAKLMEEIPAGYEAIAFVDNTVSFSFADQKVKFVWATLPQDDEISLSYKIIPVKGAQPAIPAYIKGEFSYAENNNTKSCILPQDELKLGGNPSVTTGSSTLTPTSNTTTPVTNTTTPVTNTTTPVTNTTTPVTNTTTPVTNTTTPVTNTTTPVTNTTTPVTNTTTPVTNTTTPVTNTTTPVTNTTTPTTNTVTSNNAVTSVTNKDNGVNYSVQIGAFKNLSTAGPLAAKYGLKGIRSEFHEGLNKFTVGNFPEYKQARDHRESVKAKGVTDAFVTAYNSGKRITVQEALMITNQKWFR